MTSASSSSSSASYPQSPHDEETDIHRRRPGVFKAQTIGVFFLVLAVLQNVSMMYMGHLVEQETPLMKIEVLDKDIGNQQKRNRPQQNQVKSSTVEGEAPVPKATIETAAATRLDKPRIAGHNIIKTDTRKPPAKANPKIIKGSPKTISPVHTFKKTGAKPLQPKEQGASKKQHVNIVTEEGTPLTIVRGQRKSGASPQRTGPSHQKEKAPTRSKMNNMANSSTMTTSVNRAIASNANSIKLQLANNVGDKVAEKVAESVKASPESRQTPESENPQQQGKTNEDSNNDKNKNPDRAQEEAMPVDAIKCSPWDVSIDDWWQDHPGWEVSDQDTNDSHTCFRPIDNPERVMFLERVHELQFPQDTKNNCSTKPKDPMKMAVRKIWEHGFASTIVHILNGGFWSAYSENRTFRHTIPNEDFRWTYSPRYHKDNSTANSWAACPSEDHECYFLPISSCPRPKAGTREEAPKKKYIYTKDEASQEKMIWLSHYLMRPRQVLRRKFYQFWKHANVPKLETPCTWIHVRRGDAMSEKGYDRNFYSIQEYLTKGKVNKGENVLLLTDDAAAIEEAHLLHPEYNWTHWNRPRNRGVTAFNSHFPSHDLPLEVLNILAERKLASRCQKGVHGKTNMAKLFRNAMVLEYGSLSDITMVEIDRRLKKTRVEPHDFMKDLEAQLSAARKKQRGSPKPRKSK